MNNKDYSRLNAFSMILAIVIAAFAFAVTVNGQQPFEQKKGDNVVTIWDNPTLAPGEGSYGFVPSWFVLLKVEDRHSDTYFGSACFITDRLILSCEHNIRGAKTITARNGPGDTFTKIKVLLQSPKLDLSLLLVEDENVPYHRVLSVSDSDFTPEGRVHAVGFVPSDDAICRYEGKLTGKSYGRAGLRGAVSHGHTAKVVQGMSGGPLINDWGEVVGVNTHSSKATKSLATNLTRIHWFLDQYDGSIQED